MAATGERTATLQVQLANAMRVQGEAGNQWLSVWVWLLIRSPAPGCATKDKDDGGGTAGDESEMRGTQKRWRL